jgi:hypothetical protein
MQSGLRPVLTATIVGILTGILTAIDPILPATNLVTSSTVLRAINPVLILLRFVIWSGLFAAIGGYVVGYQQRKASPTTRSYGTAVLFGWSIWVAIASYFAVVAAIVATHTGLRTMWLQQLNDRFTAGDVGFGPGTTPESILSSMGILTLVVVGVLGAYNMGMSVVASWIGGMIARRQKAF